MKKNELINQYNDAHLHNLAYKTFINGFYGAQANVHFKYFNINSAMSITAGGRYVLKLVIKYLEKEGYKINYSDTDSIFVLLGDYLNKKIPNFKQLSKTEQFKIVKEEISKIENLIKKIIKRGLESLNSFDETIEMEFELLSDYTLFLKVKKKYIMKKYYDGDFYTETSLKARNLDLIKSSTPEKIKPTLKNILNSLMEKDHTKALHYYKELKNLVLKKLSIDDLAVSSKVNKLESYQIMKKNGIYTFQKATPQHIKASLIYNILIDEYKLPLEKIKQGDIVKYIYITTTDKKILKLFNIDDVKVIAWKDKEIFDKFDINPERNKIFKLIISELKNIYDVIKTDKNPFIKHNLVQKSKKLFG